MWTAQRTALPEWGSKENGPKPYHDRFIQRQAGLWKVLPASDFSGGVQGTEKGRRFCVNVTGYDGKKAADPGKLVYNYHWQIYILF